MSRDLFAAAVREQPLDLGLACTLIAQEADEGVQVTAELAHLDAFAALARPLVEAQPATPAGWARGLAQALGEQAGFAGCEEDYEDLRASLLPDVLRRRHGLPILLTVVWAEVGRRLGVPVHPLALPGHVVALVGEPAGENVVVDPFFGGRTLSVHDVAETVRRTGVPFSRGLLTPTPPHALLLRILTNIRLLAARREELRVRRWAVELSLLLPHHPAALRREHGELLVRLGDYLGGAAELELFAEAATDSEPAAAAAARAAARAARSRLN